MNLLNNKLKQLQKENEVDMAGIRSGENKKELLHMIQYISSSSMSLFQIEVIRKDLIGMALEADREQMLISQKLGTDIKKFCDEIIESQAEYPAKKERMAMELVTAIQYLAVFYAAEFILMHSAPSSWGISGLLSAAVLIYFFLTRTGSIYLRNRLSLDRRACMRRLYILAAVLGISFYAVVARVFLYGRTFFLIRGNGWLILGILLLIAVFATLAMNRYWDLRSEDYNY